MSALAFLNGAPSERPGCTWTRLEWPGRGENWVLRDNATGEGLVACGTMEFSPIAWSYAVLVGGIRPCSAVVNADRLAVMEEAERTLVDTGYTLAQPVQRPKPRS